MSDKKETLEAFRAVVTDTDGLKFHAQLLKNGAPLDALMEQIRKEFESGTVTPLSTLKAGVKCAAKFSEDNCWYRAVVESVNKNTNKILVKFIDYGNVG